MSSGQRPEGCPYQPQRQGFMAPTSMKRLGQRDAARGAGDGHLAVLERRAEGFKHIAVELGKLVQKQHAVVGQREISAGRERPAAAGHGCGGKRVMRRAERGAA